MQSGVLTVAETSDHSNGGLWCALVDLCEEFSIQIRWLRLAARTGEMQLKGSFVSFGRSHSGQFAFIGEMNYMDGGLTQRIWLCSRGGRVVTKIVLCL